MSNNITKTGCEKMTKLYQYINKEHMEKMTEETISDEDWELFVHNVQDTFAEEVSELARSFWALRS